MNPRFKSEFHGSACPPHIIGHIHNNIAYPAPCRRRSVYKQQFATKSPGKGHQASFSWQIFCQPWTLGSLCFALICVLVVSICDKFLLSLQRYILFDCPPLHLLGTMALCAVDSCQCVTGHLHSRLNDNNPSSASESSVPVITSIIVLARVVATVGGDGLMLIQKLTVAWCTVAT